MTGHKEVVLNYMKEHGGITSFDAFENFGVTRLSAVIFDLKKQGYNINSTTIKSINRYGRKITYSRYNLVTD